MARTRKVLDYEIVDTALFYGATVAQVSYLLEIKGIKMNPRIIGRIIERDHKMTFSEYREKFKGAMRLQLVQKAIQMALAGDRTLMIFCLKNLAQWSDKQEVEHSGKEISINISKNDSKL